jgi:hypothetical protein
MRKLLVGGAVFVTALSMSSVAYAGEVTGNGKPLQMNSRSACAFSGLEDWASPAPQPEGGIKVDPGTVQNWGHVKQFVKVIMPNVKLKGANSVTMPDGTSEGCNAHIYPAK